MIEIRTLGRTTVSVDGEELTGEAAWPKSLALIIYMAREPGPDRRDEILGVLWPDREEKRARRALNQLLYTLRKANPKLDLESVEDAVDFGREVWLDVEEFEARIEAGDLKGAVEMYGGHFLVDLALGEPEFDHWADRQRAGLRRQFRKAALKLATDAKAAGDYDAAVAYCRRLNESDPLDDEAQHLLIECLYLRGDRVAALRQYDEYRDLLERELEVEPLEHTRELVARIRAEPAPGAPAGAEEERAEVELEPADDMPSPAMEPRPEREPGRPAYRRWGWAFAAGVLAVAIPLVLWLWPDGGATPGEPASAVTDAASELRVAVLPFEAHGFAGAEDGLPEGVAQLLAVDLDGRGPISTVSYRQVLQALEGNGGARAATRDVRSMRDLAGDLGANAFLFGDVHRAGDEVRIVVELLDAGSGAPLARATARGPRDALFDLIDPLIADLLADLSGGDAPAGE
ncbi:MAG: hypothetical protein GWN32_01080 [Gemmatimonadetes bacterium]|nr:hypothetical protein [Gemmatimonadota bacterium]